MRRLQNNTPRTAPCSDQRGAIALGTALMLLMLITLVTLAAVQVALGEQRSMRSEVQTQIAYALAEMALQRGLGHLRQNAALMLLPAASGWTVCNSARVDPPCGDGHRNLYDGRWTAFSDVTPAHFESTSGIARLHYLTRAAIAGSAAPVGGPVGLITVVGEGHSADATASAILRQDMLIAPLLAQFPESTVLAASIGVGGSASVVVNPDGGGVGVPLSLWAAADARFSGGARSCRPSDEQAARCPAASALSDVSNEGADILDVDAGSGASIDSVIAPGDVFERVFGLPSSLWNSLRGESRLVSDCAALDASTSAILWVDGDCRLAAGASVGSAAAPVILVVANGRFQASGGVFNGLLFLLTHDGGAAALNLDGDFVLNGAIAANGAIDVASSSGSDNFLLRYDASVAEALRNGAAAPRMLIPVPGSWRDY